MLIRHTYWLAIVVWGFVGILFIGVLIPTPVYIIVYNEATEYTQQYYDLHDDFEGAVFGKIINNTLFNAAFWTAVATIAIAWFTWTLKRSTDRLWKAGKDALEVTERAFVFIDGFNPELTTAIDAKIDVVKLPERYRSYPELCITRFAAQPKWKNSGNTPTREMTIRVNWRGPEGPMPPDYVYKNAPDRFFIAPMAIEPSEIIDMSAMPRVLVDYGLNPIGAEPMIFIWGRADYEDVFGGAHFIEWCYRVRMECYDGKCLRAHFIQWGEYNRTDESN